MVLLKMRRDSRPGREVGVQGLLLQPVRGLSLLKPELGTDGGWASEKESTRPILAHACVTSIHDHRKKHSLD